MKTTKIKRIKKGINKQTYDITVEKNHNFFCNNHLIHNCDYRGEIGIILINTDPDNDVVIKDGERIAQGVLKICEQIKWDIVDTFEDLGDTTRGQGGFGHTGTK